MTWPRARLLIQKHEAKLKIIHKKTMDLKASDNIPIELLGTFTYRGPDGPKHEWRIVDAYPAYISFSITAGRMSF
jgi:hypothetical protein